MRPNITRPDFLVKFFTQDFSVEELEPITVGYPYVYGAYMLIRPFDLSNSDLLSASISDDSSRITLQFSTESMAKNVKKNCEKQFTFCGDVPIEVSTQINGKFVTLIFEE